MSNAFTGGSKLFDEYITNLQYADDITLITKSENEMKYL